MDKMITKIILEKQLHPGEIEELERLFQETDKEILDNFVIFSDSPQLCRICFRMGMAVAAVLSGRPETEKDFSEIPFAVMNLEEMDERYPERVWRRYRGLPWDICETERCLVRETTIEDVEAFYRIYAEKSITDYMDNLFDNPEDEKLYAQDYIEKVYSFYGFGMWTVCLKETGEVIGRAGLCMRAGFEEPELGYVIGVPWQKRGIAEEVCRAILSYGKKELGFRSVRVLMHPGNTASEKLCRKLGFQYIADLDLDGDGKKEYQHFRLTL